MKKSFIILVMLVGCSSSPQSIKSTEQAPSCQVEPQFQFVAPVTEPAGEDLEQTKTLVLPNIRVGQYNLNNKQQKILQLAKQIGEDVGYPETIQSIAMQETLAGGFGDGIGDKVLPPFKRSYGVMQVKIATAQWVLRHYPDLREKWFDGKKNITKEQFREVLIKNDHANIEIGAKNFALMVKYTNSWKEAVVAYNRGLGGVKEVDVNTHHYYTNVRNKLLTVVRPFNELDNGLVKYEYFASTKN